MPRVLLPAAALLAISGAALVGGGTDILPPGWAALAGGAAGLCLPPLLARRRRGPVSTRGPEPLPEVAGAQHLALLDTAPVGLWQLDRAGRTVFANARTAALLGGAAPATLAASGLRLAGPADPAGPFGFPPGRKVEADLPDPSGRRRRVTVAASPWMPGPGEGERGRESCLLTLVDITPLRAAQARVEHLAEHDPLTGLANRAQFQAALAAMAGAPGGGMLLLLDIDRFTSANDRHGHAAGDALLCAVAERLRATVRPEDLVCRMGGDEFAILAFGLGAAGAGAMAERLRAALAAPLRLGSVGWPVSASFGLACAPDHAAGGDALLRAAGLALQQARAAGGGAIHPFRPELRLAAERRERLREALAQALRGASSTSPGSRSGTCVPAGWSAPRRCCAGTAATSAAP